MEQFAYIITYSNLDIVKDGSSLHSVFHSPENDASKKVVILFVLSGFYTIPCVFPSRLRLIFSKYLIILFTTCS